MTNHINPDHYQSKSMECRDLISVMVEGLDGVEAYYMGNIIKYLYRYTNKGGSEDLKKAGKYLEFLTQDYEDAKKRWGVTDQDDDLVTCGGCGRIYHAGELVCEHCSQAVPADHPIWGGIDTQHLAKLQEELDELELQMGSLERYTPEDLMKSYDPADDPYKPLPLWDNSDLTAEDYSPLTVGLWLTEEEVAEALDEEEAVAKYYNHDVVMLENHVDNIELFNKLLRDGYEISQEDEDTILLIRRHGRA